MEMLYDQYTNKWNVYLVTRLGFKRIAEFADVQEAVRFIKGK